MSLLDQWIAKPRTGGFTTVKDVPITVDPAVDYTSGDVIGPIVPVEVGRSDKDNGGIIKTVTLINNATIDAIDIYFFDKKITIDADNAAFTPSFEELKSLIPKGVVSAATYITLNSVNYSESEVTIPYGILGSEIYVVLIAKAAINFGDNSDLHLRVGILQD